MKFWHNVIETAGMAGSFHLVLLGFIIAALVLLRVRPREVARVRAAALLFALGCVGVLLGGALLYVISADHVAYVTIRGISRFLEIVAIVNLAGVFLFSVVLSALRFEAPRILQDLLSGVAYIIVALVVLSSSGIDLRGIVATSAVMTAVIGFSLQDTLGNIMSGMAVQMDRTIRVGDWIRVGETEGLVREIRWRQTSIETREWDTVVIPNSMLMKGTVTLLGRRNGESIQSRRWVYFNVDFRRSPTEVIRIVEAALLAEALDSVAANPKPHCIVTSFTESWVSYAARYWLTDLARPDPVDSLVRTRIFSALQRAGIPLSIPAHAVFLTEDDEHNRERKKVERLQRHIAVLEKVPLFHSLNSEERSALAGRLKGAPFIEGEAITRQGADAHWLYIIASGDAEVHVTINGNTKHVATLHPGDFFGEMGMMTGEPRSASVYAKTDVKCYRLGNEDFHDIVHNRPQIADDIAHTLARRRLELEVIQGKISLETQHQRMQQTKGDLLGRIRGFFGLRA